MNTSYPCPQCGETNGHLLTCVTAPRPHNPDNLTSEQVGVSEGWRLLDEDEIGNYESLSKVEPWRPYGRWFNYGYHGSDKTQTYRTCLSRAELRAARGLEPEVLPSTSAHDCNTEYEGCGECPKCLTAQSSDPIDAATSPQTAEEAAKEYAKAQPYVTEFIRARDKKAFLAGAKFGSARVEELEKERDQARGTAMGNDKLCDALRSELSAAYARVEKAEAQRTGKGSVCSSCGKVWEAYDGGYCKHPCLGKLVPNVEPGSLLVERDALREHDLEIALTQEGKA